MRSEALLAATLVMAPLGAGSANLVVWWENGFHAQEDEAVAEIPAAFEQEGGRQVELVQPTQAAEAGTSHRRLLGAQRQGLPSGTRSRDDLLSQALRDGPSGDEARKVKTSKGERRCNLE